MNHSSTVHAGWDIPDRRPASSDDFLECLALLTHHYGIPCSRDSLKKTRPTIENGKLTAEVLVSTSSLSRLACKIHDSPTPQKLNIKSWHQLWVTILD